MLENCIELLKIYEDSGDVRNIQNVYDELLRDIQSEMDRLKNMCFVEKAGFDIAHWIKLYTPPVNEALTDKERVIDALSFFVGSPMSRIKSIAANICRCPESDVTITEKDNVVHISVPLSASLNSSLYTEYLAGIKPAHIELIISRQRKHGEMSAYTHGELSQYTHLGQERS